MLRPCLAVVRAARALAWAADVVWFFAVVRARRPVDLLGDLAAVLRDEVERDVLRVEPVLREAARVRVDLARGPGLRVADVERAGLRAVEVLAVRFVLVLVVLAVSAISAIS